MRPRRPLIHVGCCNGPGASCDFHEVIDFLCGWYVGLGHILNKNSPFLVGSNLQISLAGVYEISQFLHVQLYHWYLNPELNILRAFRNGVKYLHNHSGYDARLLANAMPDFSLHGVCFAWRCLTIREYCAIESFNHAIDDWRGSIAIHFRLCGVAIEYLIKWESQWLCVWIFIYFWVVFNGDCFIIKQLMHCQVPLCSLSLVYWSKSANHFNIAWLLFGWHPNRRLTFRLFKLFAI